MEIEFRHLRARDEDGRTVQKGGISFGVVRHDEEDVFIVAIAACSLKDTFSRQIARELIEERIQNNEYDAIDLDTIKEFMIENRKIYFNGLTMEGAINTAYELDIHEININVLVEFFMSLD